VLHFLDAQLRIGRVDKQLADYIVREHKPAIFVVNKWDLVKDRVTTEAMGEYVHRVFPMLEHVPIAFISAKSGRNVLRVVHLAAELHKQAGMRVNTGDLNRVLRQALEAYSPPLRHNRVPKLYYATQVAVHPPTIVLFTNGPELFDAVYLRYLSRVLREHFPFPEVALKLVLRGRSGGSGSGGDGDAGGSEALEMAAEQRADSEAEPFPSPQEEATVQRREPPTRRSKPDHPDTWKL
jgi:GTP-binding protein